MKRIFEIEFPDDCGPLWMNKSNLLLCLTEYCRNTQFTVRDVTGDDCDASPESAGPIGERRRPTIEELDAIFNQPNVMVLPDGSCGTVPDGTYLKDDLDGGRLVRKTTDERLTELLGMIQSLIMRVDHLEQVTSELNHRTIGSVRLGPRRKSAEEEADDAKQCSEQLQTIMAAAQQKKSIGGETSIAALVRQVQP